MKHHNMIFILIITFNARILFAGPDDTPIQLFKCTIPSESMNVDVSGVQRGSEYEIIEGSNLFRPVGIINIEKPVFKKEKTKCLYSFKKGEKEIFIDKNKGEIFTSTKTLGKCTFTQHLKGCESDEQNKLIQAPPKNQQSFK